MARPPQFSAQAILEATAQLAATRGPAGTTIGAIAQELRAPTGSIYHRFASRDVLFAELWLQTVENFQAGFRAELAGLGARRAGLEAALYTPRWVRAHRVPARLLLLHHRGDFVPGDWPPEVADRAARLGEDLANAIRDFAKRALGTARADALRRARLALVDLPSAAVGPHLRADEELPAIVERLIADAYLALIPARPRG